MLHSIAENTPVVRTSILLHKHCFLYHFYFKVVAPVRKLFHRFKSSLNVSASLAQSEIINFKKMVEGSRASYIKNTSIYFTLLRKIYISSLIIKCNWNFVNKSINVNNHGKKYVLNIEQSEPAENPSVVHQCIAKPCFLCSSYFTVVAAVRKWFQLLKSLIKCVCIVSAKWDN